MAHLGQPAPTIAVVGAGASGTLTAIHLLARAQRPVKIVLLDRRPQPGRGVAYGTSLDAHLLNVRAANMSAFPDNPRHFVQWLPHAPDDGCRAASGTDFVSRRVYGQYLAATLRAAQVSAHPGVLLDVRQDQVVALAPDQRTLELRGGAAMSADRTVLALGTFPPRPLLSHSDRLSSSDPHVTEDPWVATALEDLDPGAPVFLVGTGLTMVDVVVSLVLERRHQGPIYAVSRRGLLPQVHSDTTGYTRVWADSDLPADTLGLLRRVRAEIRLAAQQGHDWRAVVDSLRPATQSVWQRAPVVERERFLRHVQPFWDTHRHRVAPRIGRLVADAQARGQLKVWAGRVLHLARLPDGVHVEVAARRGGRSTVEVARVINCTGPAANFERLDDPLVASLLRDGLGRPDPLHLGLVTANDGRLVAANGDRSQRVFTLGPMRRGELWETTAVPDIRVQAARLAEVLVSELGAG